MVVAISIHDGSYPEVLVRAAVMNLQPKAAACTVPHGRHSLGVDRIPNLSEVLKQAAY